MTSLRHQRVILELVVFAQLISNDTTSPRPETGTAYIPLVGVYLVYTKVQELAEQSSNSVTFGASKRPVSTGRSTTEERSGTEASLHRKARK